MTEIKNLDPDIQALIRNIKNNPTVYAIWLRAVAGLSEGFAEGLYSYEEWKEDFFQLIHQCSLLVNQEEKSK